jgi:hypothetical protein
MYKPSYRESRDVRLVITMYSARKFDWERVSSKESSARLLYSFIPCCTTSEVDTGKEGGDEAEGNARIESRRKKIIVSHPSTEVEVPHEPLEDATDQDPR